jgi:hypothetical protein
MSFTFPNVFKQSKARTAPSQKQQQQQQQQQPKDRLPTPTSPSLPRSRTMSMASVHSVAARMTTSFDATWQNEQQHSAIDTDDLEENPFFIAFKSLPYIQIFLRSALVCIPRSQSIVGLTINRRTLGQYNP